MTRARSLTLMLCCDQRRGTLSDTGSAEGGPWVDAAERGEDVHALVVVAGMDLRGHEDARALPWPRPPAAPAATATAPATATPADPRGPPAAGVKLCVTRRLRLSGQRIGRRHVVVIPRGAGHIRGGR